jgi:hypothetical protein
MLGYSYEDIQGFGKTLTSTIEVYSELKLDPSIKEGLLDIWDFFEGLLGEGYIVEEVGASE